MEYGCLSVDNLSYGSGHPVRYSFKFDSNSLAQLAQAELVLSRREELVHETQIGMPKLNQWTCAVEN